MSNCPIKLLRGLADKLHRIYKMKFILDQIHLERAVYSLKINDTSNLQEHLKEFNNIISKLKPTKVKSVEDKNAMILNSKQD